MLPNGIELTRFRRASFQYAALALSQMQIHLQSRDYRKDHGPNERGAQVALGEAFAYLGDLTSLTIVPSL